MELYGTLCEMKTLYQAWNKVRKNHSSAGVDHVTVEEFESNKKVYLKQLAIELQEQRYNTKPAKMVTITQGNKERDVTILCMRDKVVQQMIVQKISQIYEPLLSPNAYAYRPGKSALSALEYITGHVEEHTEYGVLKTDIRHFFDCIDREILIEKLKEKISDEKFLYLLKTCLSMRYVNAEGELHERKDGIYQGSLLAPVLSNIYMMEFDKIIAKQCLAYVRYSDDIICICPNVVDCESLLKNIKMQMSLLKLEIKDAKTSISKAGEGFTSCIKAG